MLNNKFENLQKYLLNLNEQGLCLAFSGGIDSTLLLYLCREMNIAAVTFCSEFQTEDEISMTSELCGTYGVKHLVVKYSSLENSVLVNNPKDRCYHCKKMFFSKLLDVAKENHLMNVIDGTNYDDLSSYRPGLKALEELGIISPFAKFEITKSEIRDFAKICGITIYDKPSTPCIATRFPYDTKLSKEKIERVKMCEKFIRNAGFEDCRVRMHETIARLEIPGDRFEEFLQIRTKVIKYLKDSGFGYITLDLEGLRSGSMDI